MDRIDKKIVDILKKYGRSTMTDLMIKTFAREGQKAFRNRLKTLEKNKVITIENLSRHGRIYNIELAERFK